MVRISIRLSSMISRDRGRAGQGAVGKALEEIRDESRTRVDGVGWVLVARWFGDNRAADAEHFGATMSHLEVSVKLTKAG
jgi:hypothetical protein